MIMTGDAQARYLMLLSKKFGQKERIISSDASIGLNSAFKQEWREIMLEKKWTVHSGLDEPREAKPFQDARKREKGSRKKKSMPVQ